MKELTGYFTNKNVIFKEIKKTEPKELGSRKKIEIYIRTTYATGDIQTSKHSKTRRHRVL